jgi:hypothetical protein
MQLTPSGGALGYPLSVHTLSIPAAYVLIFSGSLSTVPGQAVVSLVVRLFVRSPGGQYVFYTDPIWLVKPPGRLSLLTTLTRPDSPLPPASAVASALNKMWPFFLYLTGRRRAASALQRQENALSHMNELGSSYVVAP